VEVKGGSDEGWREAWVWIGEGGDTKDAVAFGDVVEKIIAGAGARTGMQGVE